MSAPTYSEKHPHEPEIPPAFDAEGRCLVCALSVRLARTEEIARHQAVEIDELNADVAQAEQERGESDGHWAALTVWQAWLREHLDALPADEDEFDDDDRAVLSSLRYVVELEPGCTEAADYEGTGKWEAMQTLRAALAASGGREAPKEET